MIISTKINRDPEDGSSKGHGFVSFDNFSSSDLAISQMNGQYLSGKQIRCEYAVKKESKGEKHGTFAERLLAENKPNSMSKMPSLIFNTGAEGNKGVMGVPVRQTASSELPFAKGGINLNSLVLPPKPNLQMKMPDIKLPPMPLPPPPK